MLFPIAVTAQAVGTSDAGAATAVPIKAAHCELICAPTITLMSAVLRTHLAGGPVVQSLPAGAPHRLPGTTSAELIISAAATTIVPRVSVFGSVQWLPNASESRNPFTLYTASELGTHVRANAPTVTMGASIDVIPAKTAGGWVDLAANVADLYSQAARPGDRSAYTQKLDLDLVAHVSVFNRTAPRSYAHRVSLFAILDYIATGLPRAGDEVPQGRLFLSRARPLALITGLALPLTPPVE